MLQSQDHFRVEIIIVSIMEEKEGERRGHLGDEFRTNVSPTVRWNTVWAEANLNLRWAKSFNVIVEQFWKGWIFYFNDNQLGLFSCRWSLNVAVLPCHLKANIQEMAVFEHEVHH